VEAYRRLGIVLLARVLAIALLGVERQRSEDSLDSLSSAADAGYSSAKSATIISGRLVDASGQPIQGASYKRVGDYTRRFDVTGDEGQFAVEATPPRFAIRFERNGAEHIHRGSTGDHTRLQIMVVWPGGSAPPSTDDCSSSRFADHPCPVAP
jgi:hypothetical protein